MALYFHALGFTRGPSVEYHQFLSQVLKVLATLGVSMIIMDSDQLINESINQSIKQPIKLIIIY